jgi:hypothetical protein
VFLALDRPDRSARSGRLPREEFRSGPAWRETDEGETNYPTLIGDLLSGQYEQPLRVVAFNPVEGSRDASDDVVLELARRVDEENREISEALREFIESHIGLPVGMQLVLPVPEFIIKRQVPRATIRPTIGYQPPVSRGETDMKWVVSEFIRGRREPIERLRHPVRTWL